MTKIEPKEGALYKPFYKEELEEEWTGFGNYGPSYKKVVALSVEFVDPETGEILRNQQELAKLPLLFVRKVTRPPRYAVAAMFAEPNPKKRLITEYHFLAGESIISCTLSKDKKFEDCFHEA